MQRGLINHLDLTVSDLARSTAFYDAVLSQLGYRRTTTYAGGVPNWELQASPVALSLGLHAARHAVPHDRYAPGLHHLAFHVPSRAEVEAMHARLQQLGATVLDAPAEYDYTPGYYALFFADPDGLKLEVVHEPRFDRAGA